MTWTYDPSLAAGRDKVRFYLGDTDSAAALMTDEEIAAMLALAGSEIEAAARCADSLAARYARRTSVSIDGFSVSGADKARAFRELAASLRATAVQNMPGGLGVPLVAGVSVSEMDSADADPGRTPSRARFGMHDEPGADSIDRRADR